MVQWLIIIIYYINIYHIFIFDEGAKIIFLEKKELARYLYILHSRK